MLPSIQLIANPSVCALSVPIGKQNHAKACPIRLDVNSYSGPHDSKLSPPPPPPTGQTPGQSAPSARVQDFTGSSYAGQGHTGQKVFQQGCLLPENALHSASMFSIREASRGHQLCCRSLPNASCVLIDQLVCCSTDASQMREGNGGQMEKRIFM